MSTIADNDLKDTHLTPEDTEKIADKLTKLQHTYKAAIESINEYKHKTESELDRQKQTNWELDHQRKRMTEYGPKIVKAKVDIAALKQHLVNVGESCLAIILCHPNVNNDFLMFIYCPVSSCHFQRMPANCVPQIGYGLTHCATSSHSLAGMDVNHGQMPENFARCMEVTLQS